MMGCWNQTCGLTQLHINADEEVLVYPLVSTEFNGLAYTTPFWAPFPIGFSAKYNHYGRGCEETGVGVELALSTINSCRPAGEAIDIESFWSEIHNLSLVASYAGRQVSINFTMIKKSILEHLKTSYVFKQYVGDGIYDNYTFEDVLAGIPAVVQALEVPRVLSGNEELDRILAKFMNITTVAEQLHDDDPRNRAAAWLQTDLRLGYGPFAVTHIMPLIMEADCSARRTELLEALLTATFINKVMYATRKMWSPQVGMGNSSDRPDGYRSLCSAITDVLAAEQAWEWED